MERFEALKNIAADAGLLRDELRKSWERFEKSQGKPEHQLWAEDPDFHLTVGINLFIAVSIHLPDTAKSLRYLDRNLSTIHTNVRRSWNAMESEFRAIEVDAIRAGNLDRSKAESGANSANNQKLFPKGVPDDNEVVDVAVRIDAAQGSGRGKLEIAREYTGEDVKDCPKAKKILARIRAGRNRHGWSI